MLYRVPLPNRYRQVAETKVCMDSTDISKLRGRIAESGIQKQELARALDIHPTLLSAILHGRRPPPEGFEARVYATLDKLEAAEAAAEEARQRVLQGAAAE